jgi:hypothetical protein
VFFHAITYPIRVTFHVMCAMANRRLDLTAYPLGWEDEEDDERNSWYSATT